MAQRWLFVAVAALAASAVVANREVAAGLQIVHMLAALVVAAAAWALFAGSDIGAAWRGLGVCIAALVGYLLVNVVATANSIDVTRSVKAMVTLVLGIGVAVAVPLAVRSPAALRRLLAVVSLASVAVTVPAVLAGGQLEARMGGAVVNNRPTSAFSDPNELGEYAAVAVLLAAGWWLAARTVTQRWLAAGCAVAAAAALAVSLSRGAWLGAVAGVVLLALLHPRARRPVAVVAVAAAVGISGLTLAGLSGVPGPAGVVTARVMSASDRSANPYDVRPITYNSAVNNVLAAPLLGHGPNTFPLLQERSDSPLQFYPRRHAHNGALTVAVESGLLGLAPLVVLGLAAVWLLASGCRSVAASRLSTARAALAATSAALLAVMGHVVVDFPLRNPGLVITVWLLLGLFMASGRLALRPSKPVAPTPPVGSP